MTQRKVVFIGKKRELDLMEPMHRIFEAYRWFIKDCSSITKAKLEKPDLLVVYALDDYFVGAIEKWKQRPPTIWCYFSMFLKRLPSGVVNLPSTMSPSEFFEECKTLLRRNN